MIFGDAVLSAPVLEFVWRRDGVNSAVLFNASSGKDGKSLMRHFRDESAEVTGTYAR